MVAKIEAARPAAQIQLKKSTEKGFGPARGEGLKLQSVKNPSNSKTVSMKQINNMKHCNFAKYSAIPLLLALCCMTPQSSQAGVVLNLPAANPPVGQAFASAWTAAVVRAAAALPGGLPANLNAGNAAANNKSLPNVANPAVTVGPGVAGCNLGTSGAVTWPLGNVFKLNFNPVGGDAVSLGEPNVALFANVTPTSYSSTGALTVSAPTVTGTTIAYTFTWANSDQGCAEQVQFFDVTNPSSPVLITQQVFGGTGGSTSGSTTVTATLPAGGISDLQVQVDGAGTSLFVTNVPTLPTWALASLISIVVAAGLFYLRRKKYMTVG